MTAPPVRLNFFKLNVPAIQPALAFWREAFGFAVVQTFDEDGFIEHIMALPGQEAGPNLLLVQSKDGREVNIGSGHGPVGLVCADIAASFDHALQHGAVKLTEIFPVGPVQVAMIASPEGHQIELIELPAG
ncbi:conserved hypothetical protein [Altererythrobacter sp. B11]|uniref:VOC family protein n=1 Tax=Altererythrobacter sp. B11 TaxID=2060312 RepID=UPI000DC6F293|nr:VOC family protein [Altererythrobacter sp. B11]BBC72347.1 conserved hypothetical protein [Altererythrobacter sp. B11]